MSSVARVEVLNTGTELLFGSVINTHLSFLAQQLFPTWAAGATAINHTRWRHDS